MTTQRNFLKNILVAVVIPLALASCASSPTSTSAQTKESLPPAEQKTIAWTTQTKALFSEANRLRHDNLSKAADLYERCAFAAGAPEPCWYNLLKARSELGEPVKVLSSLVAQGRKAGLASARFENLWGSVLVAHGDFSGAKAVFKKARQLDPAYAPAARNLGIVLDLYLGELAAAKQQYEDYASLLKSQGKSDPQLENWLSDLNNRLRRVSK